MFLLLLFSRNRAPVFSFVGSAFLLGVVFCLMASSVSFRKPHVAIAKYYCLIASAALLAPLDIGYFLVALWGIMVGVVFAAAFHK